MCLTVAALLSPGQALAQEKAGFTAIAYDNLHIGVPDPAKAAAWYVQHLGGKQAPSAWRVYYGDTVLVFVKRDNVSPSAGSVIDHFALSFADGSSRMQAVQAAGGKVVQTGDDSLGSLTKGFIEDPWGVKVEIVQDRALLGFHHVHLRVPDPHASLAWYQKMFGGDSHKLKGQADGLRYGQTMLLAAKSGQPAPAPSAERAILSLAWSIDNRDRAVETLASRSVKTVSSGIAKVEGQEVPWAYVEDPNGVRIELLQRPH